MTRTELSDGSLRWFDRDVARPFSCSAILVYHQTRYGAWIKETLAGLPLVSTYAMSTWQQAKLDLERAGRNGDLAKVRWDSDSALEV